MVFKLHRTSVLLFNQRCYRYFWSNLLKRMLRWYPIRPCLLIDFCQVFPSYSVYTHNMEWWNFPGNFTAERTKLCGYLISCLSICHIVVHCKYHNFWILFLYFCFVQFLLVYYSLIFHFFTLNGLMNLEGYKLAISRFSYNLCLYQLTSFFNLLTSFFTHYF